MTDNKSLMSVISDLIQIEGRDLGLRGGNPVGGNDRDGIGALPAPYYIGSPLTRLLFGDKKLHAAYNNTSDAARRVTGASAAPAR